MKRFNFPLSISAVIFAAALAMSGCKAPTVDYQITQFSTLRIINFSPSIGSNCTPTAPIDAFWYLSGQPKPNQANAYNILYGDASVYTNLIQAGNYNVLITPHLIPGTTDVQTSITMLPSQKYSLVVTRASSGTFSSQLIQDGVPNPAQNLTYVRFMNLQPNVGQLTVRVNDPNTGDIINPVADTFGQISPYVTLQTVTDTNYTFFVTNASNQVIARLGYQTFIGGNCYTLVYAGDPCQTLADNPSEDTALSLANALRLRAFDDNSGGADITNPVSQSFRFNIVNDIDPSASPYDPNNPSDSTIGFLVNAEGFPEYNNYTIPVIPAYLGGGENVAAYEPGGALQVNYQSLTAPNPLSVQGFVPSTGSQLFYAMKLSETALLVDSNSGRPFTFLFYDTVSVKDTGLSGQLALNTHYSLVPVTDVSDPNAVTIEFVSGIIGAGTTKSSSNNYSLFYVTPAGGSVIQAPSNASKGRASGLSQILSIPVAAGSSVNLMVMDSIGEGGTGANARVAGNTASFTAQAGGIYEIVSEGTKTDPHLLIMHVQ